MGSIITAHDPHATPVQAFQARQEAGGLRSFVSSQVSHAASFGSHNGTYRDAAGDETKVTHVFGLDVVSTHNADGSSSKVTFNQNDPTHAAVDDEQPDGEHLTVAEHGENLTAEEEAPDGEDQTVAYRQIGSTPVRIASSNGGSPETLVL